MLPLFRSPINIFAGDAAACDTLRCRGIRRTVRNWNKYSHTRIQGVHYGACNLGLIVIVNICTFYKFYEQKHTNGKEESRH